MYDLIFSIYSIIQAIKVLASIIIFIMNTKENLFFLLFHCKNVDNQPAIWAIPRNFFAEKKVFFLWQSHKTTRRCSAKVSADIKAYQPIPIITDSTNEDGSDNLRETIEANYRKVKQEILSLVDSEIERSKNDSSLQHLIKK